MFPCRWMVLRACKISSICIYLPFSWEFPYMPPPLPQHLLLWDGLYPLSGYWRLDPSPVTYWDFMEGADLSEVHHYVAIPLPRYKIYTLLCPWSSPSYLTWQFFYVVFKNLIVSCIMLLSINVHSIWEFSRIVTSGNTTPKLDGNYLGSIVPWYLPTPLQYIKICVIPLFHNTLA